MTLRDTRCRALGAAGTVALLAAVLGLSAADVRADVYRELGSTGLPILDLLRTTKAPAGNHVMLVNGTRLYFQRSLSTERPEEILARMEKRANEDYGASLAAMTSPEDAPSPLSRPFRADGKGWGVVGRLTGTGPLGGEEGALARLAQDGGLGPSARDGFLVFAVSRGEPGGGSDVWTARFDESFNPLLLAPREGGGDVGEGDLPGIDRFPGSQRIMTMSDLSEGANTHSVAYQAHGSAGRHMAHYVHALRAAGYRLESEDSDQDAAMARFSGPKAEVTVYSYPAGPGSSQTIDLIQLQPKEYQNR